MNEQKFHNKIKELLNTFSERISGETADRLHAARQQALSRQKTAASGLSLAGAGNLNLDFQMPQIRTLIALCGLVLGVAGMSYWNSMQQAEEIEEIDIALLSDELPIDAYLDHGFDTWLKHSSPQ